MIVTLQSQVIKLVVEVTYEQHNGCSQLLSPPSEVVPGFPGFFASSQTNGGEKAS